MSILRTSYLVGLFYFFLAMKIVFKKKKKKPTVNDDDDDDAMVEVDAELTEKKNNHYFPSKVYSGCNFISSIYLVQMQ